MLLKRSKYQVKRVIDSRVNIEWMSNKESCHSKLVTRKPHWMASSSREVHPIKMIMSINWYW